MGDLPGILEKLDYLKWLGVDILWLSPIFPSPLADFGYDISDFLRLVEDMRRLIDAYGDRLLIGESYIPRRLLMNYYGGKRPGFHFPFNFSLLRTPWDSEQIEMAIRTYLESLPRGAWPNWVIGNHDRPRIASRLGARRTAAAALLQLTLPGTPILYYGEEIGMMNLPADEMKGAFPGDGAGRDAYRSPMQWENSPEAGFTAGKSWMPIHPDFPRRNVAGQQKDPYSLLLLYRRLIRLRQSEKVLQKGDLHFISLGHQDFLVYEWILGKEALRVILNMNSRTAVIPSDYVAGQIVL